MSYRKITVDGTVHEYTIGKTHTKIKGLGAFKNADIGSHVYGSDTIVITPRHVAKTIKGDKSPNEMLMINQLALKETGKISYLPYSKEAFIDQASYLPEGTLTKYVIEINDPDDYYDHTSYLTIESTLVKEAIIDKINKHNEHIDYVSSLRADVYSEYYPVSLVSPRKMTEEQRKEFDDKLKIYHSKYKEVELANPVGIEFAKGKLSYKLKKFEVLTLDEWFQNRLAEATTYDY